MPATQSWTIDVAPVNSAPTFTQASPQSVVMSEDGAPTAFDLTLDASDADSAAGEMTWRIAVDAVHGTATAAGSGFSQVINYVPAANYAGADAFTVEISDGEFVALLDVEVTVLPVNDAPAITSAAPVVASEGSLYQYAVQVEDIDDANNGSDLMFALTTAPAGMTV